MKTLGINSKISAVFICGVMVTSRTVTALAATFIHDLDADMFALMLACIAVYLWKEKIFGWWLVGAVVALLPLAMNLIRVLSVEEYHDLMTYAFVFLYVAAVALAEKLEVKPVGAGVGLCVALVVFCSVQTANEVYLKRNLSYQATYARMSFVLHDMEQMGYDVENEEVYILNEVPMAEYEDFGGINQLWAMEFDNVITSDKKSIENYFEYVFDYPIRFASEERANKALLSEEYIRMPSYPDEGYMEYIDGVLMVKLQPNHYHIKELEKLEAAEAE
ncbi:MAG: hypothetical protein IKU47_02850 [Oscillospiraceae bacterium]|nr:hypothetical protein [Oscillospiraceae bacterium]